VLVKMDLPPEALTQGWQMIASDIPAPVQGMQLRVQPEDHKEAVR
jgi:hypothetical protein